MKVIDLLNKIANGEEVLKKIKYKDNIFIAKGNGINGFVDYVCEELDYCFFHYIDWDTLNDEIEVIEEDKKIEKIKILNCDNYVKKENYETILTMQEIALDISTLKKWVNKIIDKLNSMEK